MYFHPLQEDITKMSDEDVSKRIKELARKVGTARRFGRNPDILSKLQHALTTYQNEIRNRRIEEWHKQHKKLRGEPDLGDLINLD
jgi:hypothetical protein